MRNQQKWSGIRFRAVTSSSRGFFVVIRSFILASVLIASNIIFVVQPVLAAALTAEEYCKTYTDTPEKNACKAGVNGQEDCNNYSLAFDQSVGDICYKAERDRIAGLVKPGNVTVTPSPSPSVTPSPVPAQGSPQGQPDDSQSLSDYIESLHEAGPDADKNPEEQPDNTKGAYINGAGKKQEIKIHKEGTGNSPAILFFNGGGWLQNDGVSKWVADGKDGAEKAGDRGYALFDVTYRLGTSSVYYAFEDVMRGVKHMRDNAQLYGIDPNKIVVWGDSAGGSLSMRVAASGKSGAKAAVGWSAPTNGYTAVFKSFQSFAIGVAHSTCAPTDLAGFANFADLAAGGSGDVAEYGMGISSNDFSALGIDLGTGSFTGISDPLTLLSQGLIAGKNLLSVSQDVEAISSQIKSGGSMSGSTFNLASKKFVECLDNFNVLSPALFASPDSAPSFLGGFEDDGLIDPSQSTGMRDKLRQLGIKSESLILPGSQDCMEKTPAPAGAGGCHLGYYKDFVCPSLDFIDSIVQPERGSIDCGSGIAENQGSNDVAANSNDSSGAGEGGGQPNEGDSQNTPANNNSPVSGGKAACEQKGGTWKMTAKGGGYCAGGNTSSGSGQNCDTWESSCSGYSLPGIESESSTGQPKILLSPSTDTVHLSCRDVGTYQNSNGQTRRIQECINRTTTNTWTTTRWL